MSISILALDLGTRSGWAASLHGRIESGVQDFSLRRGESPGVRFLRFNAWLSQWAADGWRPDLLAYEAPHHRGGAATEIANGFSTRVQEFCARHGLEHASVHSATLKKWTTGRGNADKAAMMAAVSRRWGEYLGNPRDVDDNQADAMALLHYALAELVGPALGLSRASYDAL